MMKRKNDSESRRESGDEQCGVRVKRKEKTQKSGFEQARTLVEKDTVIVMSLWALVCPTKEKEKENREWEWGPTKAVPAAPESRIQFQKNQI